MGSGAHYPWLWDSEMDNRTFEAVLRGGTAVPPHDVRWAIVRLVEYAPFSEIKRLLPVQTFLDLWPEIAVRVRSRTRREGMEFYYHWLLEQQMSHV